MNAPTHSTVATGLRKSVLVVSSDPVTQNELASILSRTPDFVVCGWAGNTAKAIAAIAVLNPAAVVVDVSLEGGRGLGSIRDLRLLHPRLTVIASVHGEHLLAMQAMKIGASGFVMGEDFAGSLRRALAKAKTLPQPRTNPPPARS